MSKARSVLIFGGSGFVGTNLCLRFRQNYKVFATFGRNMVKIPGVTFFPANLEGPDWVTKVMFTAEPEIVIFAAGQYGSHPALFDVSESEKMHTLGLVTIVRMANVLGAKVIFLSPAYMFDGGKGNYGENDLTLPVTHFGRVKIAAENLIRAKAANFIILRSSPLYGRGPVHRPSFIDRLRVNLMKGETLQIPNFEIHSWAPMPGFVDVVETLVSGGPKNEALHYSGLTKMTTYDFAVTFARRHNLNSSLILSAGLPPSLKKRTKLADFSLNCSATVKALKFKPLELEDGFRAIEAIR